MSGIAVGVGDVVGGSAGLCAQGMRWIAARAASAFLFVIATTRRAASTALADLGNVAGSAIREAAHFARRSRDIVLRLVTNPWVWLAAIAAPLLVWAVIRFVAITSDTDHMTRFIKGHPIVAWSVMCAVLLIEVIILGVAALNFLRRLYISSGKLIRAIGSSLARWYRSLPSGAQTVVRRIPYFLRLTYVIIQLATIGSLVWLFASRISASAWIRIAPIATGVVLLGVLLWLAWRILGARVVSLLESWLVTFARTREALDRWLAERFSAVRRLFDQLISGLLRFTCWSRDQIISAAKAAHGARFEFALVKHHGSKTPGPKFGVSLLEFSLASFALIALGLFSVSALDFSGVQISLFPSAHESSHKQQPKPHHRLEDLKRSIVQLATNTRDNAGRLLAQIVASANRALDDIFATTSLARIQTFNGMAPSQFSWSHGSNNAFEPMPEASLRRFNVGDVCRYDAVLAVGAASSDGPAPANQRLSRSRAQVLAHVLEPLLQACRTRPALVAIWLGESSASQAASAQRQLFVFGIAHLGRQLPRHFTADALHVFLHGSPAFIASASDYSMFEACRVSGNDGNNALPECASWQMTATTVGGRAP